MKEKVRLELNQLLKLSKRSKLSYLFLRQETISKRLQ